MDCSLVELFDYDLSNSKLQMKVDNMQHCNVDGTLLDRIIGALTVLTSSHVNIFSYYISYWDFYYEYTDIIILFTVDSIPFHASFHSMFHVPCFAVNGSHAMVSTPHVWCNVG